MLYMHIDKLLLCFNVLRRVMLLKMAAKEKGFSIDLIFGRRRLTRAMRQRAVMIAQQIVAEQKLWLSCLKADPVKAAILHHLILASLQQAPLRANSNHGH